jgi:hypothetical protein
MSNSHAERPTQNCLPVIPSKLEDAVQSAVVPAHSKKGVLVRGIHLECGNPAAAGPLLKTAR